MSLSSRLDRRADLAGRPSHDVHPTISMTPLCQQLLLQSLTHVQHTGNSRKSTKGHLTSGATLWTIEIRCRVGRNTLIVDQPDMRVQHFLQQGHVLGLAFDDVGEKRIRLDSSK
jgi:hypothetical protein